MGLVGQQRDNFLPETRQELGAAMSRLRGRRLTLRQLAAHLNETVPGGVSRTTLWRYEKGEALPPLDIASQLDDAYGAGGWLMYALAHFWQRGWDPWADGWPATTHAHRWPAPYGGAVWMDLRPSPHDVGQVHQIRLAWGPWERFVEVPIPAEGKVLLTGKAADDDGVARTLNLDSDRQIYVLWGAGDLDLNDRRILDIRRGWVRVEASGPEDRHGPQSR
jgi:hypothetical protein